MTHRHIYTSIDTLQERLAGATVLSYDFETSGLLPRISVIGGLGIFLPESETYFYLNLGHQAPDPRYPKIDPIELRDALQPFFGTPSNLAVGFNLPFDTRFLAFRLGVEIRCRLRDAMIETHRIDTCLRREDDAPTYHSLTTVQYGLKELTAVYFRERPPHILDATDGYSVISTPPHQVARYCCLDCLNAWRIHEFNEARMGTSIRRLMQHIDDRNVWPLSKMLWEGLGINRAEIQQQIDNLTAAETNCRDEIWNVIGNTPLLGKRTDVKRFLADYLGDERFLWKMDAERLLKAYESNEGERQQVVALVMMLLRTRQRINSFLKPLLKRLDEDRVFIKRFDSTTKTTRFKSSPNMQALPKRSDKGEKWENCLPPSCRPTFRIRNVIQAKPGYSLIEIDMKSVEPRYLAELMQRALDVKDLRFRERKNILKAERRERYPELLQRMYDTQLPYEFQQTPIEWPDYGEEGDPLWRVFQQGGDPYNALLIAIDSEGYNNAVAEGRANEWLAEYRPRGKKCFLALGYGSSAVTLAPKLEWDCPDPVARTKQAIQNLETQYATLNPLRELTRRELFQTGEVETLWKRPYRVNGYYQLAHSDRLSVRFRRYQPTKRTYEAEIIPLGTYRQGVQCLVLNCWYVNDDETRGECVLQGNPNGTLRHADMLDVFVRATYYNTIPFRNIAFSTIQWIREENGLIRYLPRQESAFRMAFNAMCQATGADHIRWVMNNIDTEVCNQPDFSDCRLVLSIHDSLVYETPDDKIDSFLQAIAPIARRRPDWATIDYDIEATVGKRFGQMENRPI